MKFFSNIRFFFRPNRVFLLTVLVALALNSWLWWYLAGTLTPQDTTMPIHYNIYFGIDLLGPWWYLFFLPGAGLAVWLVNSVLAMIFFRRDRLAPIFLVGASVLIQVLLILTALSIIHQVS